MNLQPLLDALDIQENAAQGLADDLRTRIGELQARLRETETHLEHLARPHPPTTSQTASVGYPTKLHILTGVDAGSFARKQ